MTIPKPTDDELRQVHTALHVSVPFEQMSPFIRHYLEMVAHCWSGQIPAHLFGKPVAVPTSKPLRANVPDFKRRAAGDFE
ncbi:hypothetical protein ACO0LC_12925 [Undibacterium sp. JH2W]|uniref:hypothetical protein n=1 Tax=Undibacterium sp. JH2W TaxID=3413037 RepID=UPI003BF43F0B